MVLSGWIVSAIANPLTRHEYREMSIINYLAVPEVKLVIPLVVLSRELAAL
jgi:hypothetical protein